MSGKSTYLKFNFYYLLIFFIAISGNILSQDNTNNSMQGINDTKTDEMDKMIHQNANYYSGNLRTELNLTRSQTKYIYDILYSYYTNETGNETSQIAAARDKRESLNLEQDPLMRDDSNIRVMDNISNKLTDAKDNPLIKIESILDHEQMNKWNLVKDTWWSNAKSVLPNINESSGGEDINFQEKREYEDNRDYENYDVYYPGYDIK